MKLYSDPISGNSYKVRLFLSMLGLNYETIPVSLRKGEHLSEDFKLLNPRGQIPVLVDDGTAIWDSIAILVYLARQYGKGRWLPSDAVGEAKVMQWLAVSENELQYGLARARAVLKWQKPYDLTQCQAEAYAGLTVMNQQLAQNEWLASNQPSIADIACYPHIALASEAQVCLETYPNVQRWLKQVESLPGYVPMS
ncbi:MAG: glutathione S-transferase family protein [Candidatus Thiocaldithrix dubininis]|uniref:Glutathione S-transferase family protein n=1 Tax=Candidatus Thiocaldithrix dubininis TaxID=3080823 RepID=A0AA95KLS8_9GAMM|nr:MAG: glutathione S-transferase family protein [Candidatus Thiocaldithrix dubininis]